MGLLAALGFGACQAECDGLIGNPKPGLDPPTNRIFFPVGLGLSPDGRWLFVASGNHDVKFNGGTISVVDVDALLARIADPASDPAGCRYAPAEPSVVECDEASMMRPTLTVRTGNFPGFIHVEDLSQAAYPPWMAEVEAGQERRYRLYTPVRADPSLTFIDVITSTDATDPELLCLDCGQGCASSGIQDCSSTYRVEAPSTGRDPVVAGDLPDEPYGLAMESAGAYMVVAHLVNGSMSLVDLAGYQGDSRRGGPDLVDILPGVMGEDSEGRSGGYNVVLRSPGDPADWIYVTNRAAAQILTMRVSGGDELPTEDRGLQLLLGPSIVLTAPVGPLESGADLRGLAMAPGGERLYAVTRTPPALLSVDTSLEDGMPRNEVLDVVEVCPQPSVLRIRQGPLGRTLAYVACYSSGEIYIIDADDSQLIDRIDGLGGPHDLIFMPQGPQVPIERQGYGFVAQFGEHTIGVIDLNPDSPTYHQLIARIGYPEELRQ